MMRLQDRFKANHGREEPSGRHSGFLAFLHRLFARGRKRPTDHTPSLCGLGRELLGKGIAVTAAIGGAWMVPEVAFADELVEPDIAYELAFDVTATSVVSIDLVSQVLETVAAEESKEKLDDENHDLESFWDFYDEIVEQPQRKAIPLRDELKEDSQESMSILLERPQKATVKAAASQRGKMTKAPVDRYLDFDGMDDILSDFSAGDLFEEEEDPSLDSPILDTATASARGVVSLVLEDFIAD